MLVTDIGIDRARPAAQATLAARDLCDLPSALLAQSGNDAFGNVRGGNGLVGNDRMGNGFTGNGSRGNITLDSRFHLPIY